MSKGGMMNTHMIRIGIGIGVNCRGFGNSFVVAGGRCIGCG